MTTDGPQPPSAVGDDLGLGLSLPGGVPTDAQGRRRLHPVSPVVHGISAIPVGLLILVSLSFAGFAAIGPWVLGLAFLALIALPLAVAGVSYLGWRNRSYWFDADGDLRVDSGILTRQQRRLQLSRLQSVDVVQPLFARFFSLAEVIVEVAGSGDSRVRLQFLALAEGRALRSEILARAAGLRHDVGEAPEAEITRVAPRDLALSLLARSVTAVLLLATALLLTVAVLTNGILGLGLALVTGGLPIVIVVAEFIRYFGFTVSQSPDGLRLRFGLARTETRTVPPGRVQAIEYVEPLLWRRWRWIRVKVNIAGVGRSDSQGNQEETLLVPVATREVADGIVARVLPDLDLDALDWHRAPDRSRWRAPIQWRRLAVAWNDDVLVTRRGRVTRRLTVIPHVRTQSVRLTQGPWERALGLATAHVDSTPGPVEVMALHLDAALARRVVDEQAARARVARAADRGTRWMEQG